MTDFAEQLEAILAALKTIKATPPKMGRLPSEHPDAQKRHKIKKAMKKRRRR